MKPRTVSVIISTYNNTEWLEKTLYGFMSQTCKDFDIVIADDGSGKETADLIERFGRETDLKIKHVWHPDNGFQKCLILNKAIMATDAEYLIMTDQDCVPREDYVAGHLKYARKGYFISAGYFKLPMTTSKLISKDDILSGRAFKLKWLFEHGLKKNFKAAKLFRGRLYSAILNRVVPVASGWNGCNSSCWRDDALAVNGFNTEMRYGAEDREFGYRLLNLGVKSKLLRYTLITLHLDHARPYKSDEIKSANKALCREVAKNRVIKTPHGIAEMDA